LYRLLPKRMTFDGNSCFKLTKKIMNLTRLLKMRSANKAYDFFSQTLTAGTYNMEFN